ncbi:MAG: PAS domain S-box protein [bacterium]|nr:PAS domain S-box protein [bacterium]
MIKPNEKFKLGEHLPFIGAMFALGFWLADILIDALLFGEGTVSQQLLRPEPMEVYFRLIVAALFILFGAYSGRLIRKQQQLKSENQFKAMVLDQVNDVIMIHDYNGRIIYFNEATLKMRGFSRSELIKMKMAQITAPQYREMMPSRMKEIREKGGLVFEASTLNQDGSSTPVEVHASLIEMDGVPMVLSIARDVSLRREHEQARDRLLKELQTAMIKIKTLNGMIPICSNCKKLRNDDGYWQQVEEYLRQHTDADFSHGLCDQCSAELYPEFSVPKKH